MRSYQLIINDAVNVDHDGGHFQLNKWLKSITQHLSWSCRRLQLDQYMIQ